MQKIIELTTKDFMTGLAVSSHMPSSGIFHEASGINPYRDAFTQTDNTGLLQTSAGVSLISGVSGSIWSAAYLGSSYLAYYWGDAGKLYEMSSGSPASPTLLRTVSNPSSGLAIYQPPKSATKRLLYWQLTQFGTWDFAASYNDGAYTGLQSTSIHPTHHFVGNIYYGNKDRLGVVTHDGAGNIQHVAGVETEVLDIASDMIITTLNDDGYYLVIGATTNRIAGNLAVHTLNKIYFWDTNSSSWQKEWEIPTAFIASIQRVGNFLYALCADGLYAFNFSTPPTLIVPLSNNDGPSTVGGVSPTHEIACVRDSVIYWLSSGADVCAYGSPIPGLSPRFFKPFRALQGGVPSHLSVLGKFLFATSDEDAFGTIDNTAGGGSGLTAETIYIPLERKWDIKRIEVILGEPLASSDQLDIRVRSDEDTAASEWGTMSYALDGAVRTKVLTGEYIAENLKLFFNFTGGNVKIKKIMVFGEPMSI